MRGGSKTHWRRRNSQHAGRRDSSRIGCRHEQRKGGRGFRRRRKVEAEVSPEKKAVLAEVIGWMRFMSGERPGKETVGLDTKLDLTRVVKEEEVARGVRRRLEASRWSGHRQEAEAWSYEIGRGDQRGRRWWWRGLVVGMGASPVRLSSGAAKAAAAYVGVVGGWDED